jgi:tetrahydromethanopterin S-methyltransferase subunit A
VLSNHHEWPPVPGDFEVHDPSHSVAICTLGKKIEIPGENAIVGSCKTENIGIERVIINVISNPNIRFLILAGPEVPGHLTGRTLRALYHNGIDPQTKKIINAEGAIPYIENVPLEGVERFREQIELVDMINVLDSMLIQERAKLLANQHLEPYSKDAIWIEFKAAVGRKRQVSISASITMLPEYGVVLESSSSLVTKQEGNAIITDHPSPIIIEVRNSDTGTLLVGKEE